MEARLPAEADPPIYRKRKCDGEKPVCSLCLEAGIECTYREPENVRPVSSSQYVLQQVHEPNILGNLISL